MYKDLLFEKRDSGVGILTINKPKSMNVLSYETVQELEKFAGDQMHSEDLKALVITGSGKKAFVAGADIGQMREMPREKFVMYCRAAHGVFNGLQQAPFPVIAAVNGYALGGGCEFAVACDIRIASDNAKIGFPETKLGLFPCWGGSQRITRIMGIGKAKELIFTGKMITAEEALEIGLVDKVVGQEQLLDEVLNMADQIAANGPLAVSLAKKVINKGSDMEISQGLEYELKNGLECFDSKDRVEGMSAFLEKREADFQGC